RKRVICRDTSLSEPKTFVKSAALDKPRRGYLEIIAKGKVRHVLKTLAQLVELATCDHGILKKRPRASRVWIGLVDDHRFCTTDLEHHRSHLEKRRRITVESFDEVLVHNLRLAALCEPISDTQYDVSTSLCGIENTGSVCETA